ncbi:MAG: amylo-alpha-1,6-glucosidase [Thermoprotei archaeon]
MSKTSAQIKSIQGMWDEWLFTNLFGGYASSTMGCVNTRAYHTLLTSASNTGGMRIQLVNTLEEKVSFNNSEWHYLSTHRYTNVYHPDGLNHMLSFGFDESGLWWTFRFDSHTLLKRFSFGRIEESFRIEYLSADEFNVEVRPLISFRDHHGVIRANTVSYDVATIQHGYIAVKSEPWPLRLVLSILGGDFKLEPYWYYSFFYEEEAARGGNTTEDLYSPGPFIGRGKQVVLEARVEPPRRVEYALKKTPLLTYLAFNPHPLIVAGYYWFWDWCRDTMIVLPTLYRLTGDIRLVDQILDRYFGFMSSGFLPTGFDESGKPFYNSVDTSLWAAYALNALCELTSSKELALRYRGKLKEIYEGYRSGSMLGVKLVDGLVYHGAKGATWMDAYFEGVHYTPRNGFAVEVNALWLLLLKLLYSTATSDDEVESLQKEIQTFKASFNTHFTSTFGLYDTLKVDLQPSDPHEIRPNMLFALSLHNDLVNKESAARTLEWTRRALLTPFGLRTLNPDHPAYRPRYIGDRASRDSAYHNGTVWPWLLGAYVDACQNYDPPSVEYTRYIIEPLLRLAHAKNYILNEVFDGEPPHTPRGCVAQAWSTSELLRITLKISATH